MQPCGIGAERRPSRGALRDFPRRMAQPSLTESVSLWRCSGLASCLAVVAAATAAHMAFRLLSWRRLLRLCVVPAATARQCGCGRACGHGPRAQRCLRRLRRSRKRAAQQLQRHWPGVWPELEIRCTSHGKVWSGLPLCRSGIERSAFSFASETKSNRRCKLDVQIAPVR